MNRNDPAAEWLLDSGDPSIRYNTLTEVLGETIRSREVRETRDQIIRGPKVRTLLAGQEPDGGFGAHPYQKWTGVHRRLVSLVELSVPADEPRARAAADRVLRWPSGDAHRRRIKCINGLTRRCASQGSLRATIGGLRASALPMSRSWIGDAATQFT